MNYLDPSMKHLRRSLIKSALITSFDNIIAIVKAEGFTLDDDQLLALIRETSVAFYLMKITEIVG